jgi:hypothetical protein
MTFSELMSIIFSIAIAVVIGTFLGVVGPTLDSSSYDKEIANREFRRDMQAAAFCRNQLSGSTYQWTESGALVCIPAKTKPNQ